MWLLSSRPRRIRMCDAAFKGFYLLSYLTTCNMAESGC